MTSFANKFESLAAYEELIDVEEKHLSLSSMGGRFTLCILLTTDNSIGKIVLLSRSLIIA